MQQRQDRTQRADSVVREVWDDLRHDVRARRAQLVEAVSYVVLLAGALYLFSSVGADSGDWYDVTRRTTLAAVATGLLCGGVLLGALALVVDAEVRRRERPGAVPHHLHSRRRVYGASAAGALLAVVSVVLLVVWS